MFRQLGIGAAFALTAAALAVGCGSKGTSINNSSNGELNGGPNSLPASSISSNNVDPSDGGGFSANDAQAVGFGQFKCQFNLKLPNDD